MVAAAQRKIDHMNMDQNEWGIVATLLAVLVWGAVATFLAANRSGGR